MTVLADMRAVGGGLASRITRLGSMLARMTAVPLLVRGVVFLAGALATLAAWPPELTTSMMGVFMVGLAVIPALLPRTAAVTLGALFSVLGWLVSTDGIDSPAALLRITLLAAALYLGHSAAALAAQLPYDAIVSPVVVARWFARSGIVVGVTAVVSVYALIVGELLRGPGFILATVLGLAVAIGVVAALARHMPSGG